MPVTEDWWWAGWAWNWANWLKPARQMMTMSWPIEGLMTDWLVLFDYQVVPQLNCCSWSVVGGGGALLVVLHVTITITVLVVSLVGRWCDQPTVDQLTVDCCVIMMSGDYRVTRLFIGGVVGGGVPRGIVDPRKVGDVIVDRCYDTLTMPSDSELMTTSDDPRPLLTQWLQWWRPVTIDPVLVQWHWLTSGWPIYSVQLVTDC